MAPELLQGKFSKAADVFSLGISIMELACDLDLPKGGDGWHQLRNRQMPKGFMKGKLQLSWLETYWFLAYF
jgi:membrane-associated tyrosine/threonine-specific cdc2-inhibitory kinase